MANGGVPTVAEHGRQGRRHVKGEGAGALHGLFQLVFGHRAAEHDQRPLGNIGLLCLSALFHHKGAKAQRHEGRLPDCHPTRLAEALLTDCRIETMMKAKDFKAVAHFISHPFDLNRCWQPYKIAKRHRYEPEDYGLWCDTVSLIDKCGKDIHSVKYICPKDLKADHDRWLAKATRMEERRRDMERMVRAKKVRGGLLSREVVLLWDCPERQRH